MGRTWRRWKNAAVVAGAELSEVNLIDRAAVVGVQVGDIGGVAGTGIIRRSELSEVQLVDYCRCP